MMVLVEHTVPQEEGEVLSVAQPVGDCVAVGYKEGVVAEESEWEVLGDAELVPI